MKSDLIRLFTAPLTDRLFLFLLTFNLIYTSQAIPEDRYSTGLRKFRVTVPRKVSVDGRFLSHYLPHFQSGSRGKRDLAGEEVLSYVIPLDGVDHLVHLWPSDGFLARGLVVETHSRFGDNRSRISVRQPRGGRCHYRGVLRGVHNSRVALSTCYGLAGHVFTPDLEFFIEPSLSDDRKLEYHKHYIYKREDINQSKNWTNCGTKGTFLEALNERIDWEERYGRKIKQSITSNSLEKVYNPDSISRSKRKGGTCDGGSLDSTPCPKDRLSCPLKKPHFLEVMVTIDAKLSKSLKHDLETFILTIFNMVSSNFLDGTLGITLHIKLVRIVYLGYTLPRLDLARYSPSSLLLNFCDWQLELNPLLESHPNHHDIAVFVTRFEPCQGNILGLSNMASICRLDKSCVVVSDEGLLLANIITHQIGHSFGAEHDDGDVGGCSGEDIDGTRYHMSPLMSVSSGAWSVCSEQTIGSFINSQMSWCLTDEPRAHDLTIPDILPGQVYDAVQQCSMNFKMRTLACGTGDFCKALFCQITPDKCASTGDPPAAGTPCARDMWCFGGNCVHRGLRPGSTDGGWGSWSAWSPCTRTCGGGVQTRLRVCDNPSPQYGGRACIGPWITHKMCAVQPCLGYAPSFADVQCKMTNKRPYKGHYYLWDHFRPFFEDLKCTLVCINERNQVSIRSPVVIDGTPCMPGTENVCIRGECRRVGCDHVIESKSKYDLCGICHGNGTTCRIVQGIFHEPDLQGEEAFLKLPVGTGNIFVREVDVTTCYLIVSSALNQTFYLNSPTESEHLPGEFSVAGVTGVYEERQGRERLFIRHPIKSPITISVKCNDKDMRGIRYQYALPESRPCYIPSYKWEYLYWDECDRMCGGGVRRARPCCIEVNGGEVEDKYCHEITKPIDLIESCNAQPCSAKWWVGSWSDCDCSDGEGIMTRLVFCMRPGVEDYSLSKIVKDKECWYQPKPRVQKPCSVLKDAELFAKGRIKRQESEEDDQEKFSNDSSYTNTDDFPLEIDFQNNENTISSETLEYETTQSTPKLVTRIMPSKKGQTNKGRTMQEGRSKKKQLTSAHSGSFYERDKYFQDMEDDFRMKDDRALVTVTSREILGPTTRRKKMKKTPQNVHRKQVKKTPEVYGETQDDFKTSQSTECAKTEPFNENQTTTMKVSDLSDLFLEHIFGPSKSTTCSSNANGIEPADQGPRLESGDSAMYKMVVIPIVEVPHLITKTDIGLQLFGDSIYFPICNSGNKTDISGGNVFKIIQEARRRATKPPVIDVDLD